MRFFTFFSISLLAFALCACARTGARVDYAKQAKVAHPLVVPRGAASPKQAPYYRIPSVSVQASNTAMTLLPPGSEALRVHNEKLLKKRSRT